MSFIYANFWHFEKTHVLQCITAPLWNTLVTVSVVAVNNLWVVIVKFTNSVL